MNEGKQNILSRLICKIGIHAWYYFKEYKPQVRICTRCPKVQSEGRCRWTTKSDRWANYRYRVYLSDCEYHRLEPLDERDWLYSQFLQDVM